ncbi:MAG: serine/threonine protein kinase [Myxococcota bacterium]
MSPERKKIQTPPDILVALSGLTDDQDGPTRLVSSKPPTPEAHPTSGAQPILPHQDNFVKLPFALGSVIAGKYEIIGLIGAGGVGYVVSAMHLELGEMVALKFLREESLVHEQVVERFAREARAAARIKSEHVARVYDVGALPNGVPYIVMEYLHGKDLADIVRERGRLPVLTAVEYILQACEALASAHTVGVVHRDIKPENLFLSRQGEGVEVIKVLDFGISKLALNGNAPPGVVRPGTQNARKFAKTMMPMGTPAYMSPEQIRSTGDVDARTDIWALGCVLFELLTGTCVFDAPTLMQLGAAILEREPVPLRQLVKDAPPELEVVIQRCLQKDVSKRYQNVAELAVALYPFAPRRARISVERSTHLLRSTNPGALPLEIGSVPPPALKEQLESDAVIVAQSVPTPAVSISDPNAITESPSSNDASAMQPKRRRAIFALAGMGLALGAAALYFVLGRSAATTASSEPATKAQTAKPSEVNTEQKPVAATETPKPSSATKPSIDANQPETKASSGATRSGAAQPSPARARAVKGGHARVRPPGAPRGSGDDEFDVGY